MKLDLGANLGLSDAIRNMQGNSVQYSFEEVNGGSRRAMRDQFGESGVKAYLYEKKYQSDDQSVKGTKEYQQNLLARKSGFADYREMGEALRQGKLTKQDLLESYKELEEKGLINPENFLVEKKSSLQDKARGLQKDTSTKNFVTRPEIKQRQLRNEINAYALEEGFVDDENNPDALLFLQAVESGEHKDSKAESLFDSYRNSFDSVGYARKDYSDFKENNGLTSGEYTIENLSEKIRRRF